MLSFVGAGGFDELLNEEKKWIFLDSSVKDKFPEFSPPSVTTVKRLAGAQKCCAELSDSLTAIFTQLEEKLIVAIAEKDRAQDLVTHSESKYNDLKMQIDSLSIALTTNKMK